MRFIVALPFIGFLIKALWPKVEPYFERYKLLALALFIFLLGLLVVGLTGLTGCSLTPRSHSVFKIDFSGQAPRLPIRMLCNGVHKVHTGVAVCEEKAPKQADVSVKIMPYPGRVIYTDGIKPKLIHDFNYKSDGWWIFKNKRINETWVPLDLGEITSIYGDAPVAIGVQALTPKGIIHVRGAIYQRICNDRDVLCSRLIVEYDCAGKVENTHDGQLGSCVRLSGSAQKFRLPIKTLGYAIVEGARIRARAGQTGWTLRKTVTVADVARGEIIFLYPNVLTGPDLVSLAVFNPEQGIIQEYRTDVLLYGIDPKWTGIDAPHWLKERGHPEFCAPILSDFLEVVTDKEHKYADGGCINYSPGASRACAWSGDRESGDISLKCMRGDREYQL